VNSLREFFATDWEAMTHADWSGLIIVVVLTVLMIGLYSWIFKPSNRDHFEQHRDFVNEDAELHANEDLANEHYAKHKNDADMNREAAHGQKR